MNIRSFLTTDTTEYYQHVIEIVKDLEEISGTSIAIFGGAVRDLIRNKIPRDVDIGSMPMPMPMPVLILMCGNGWC